SWASASPCSGPITWWPGSCSAMTICSPGRPGPSPDPLDSLLPLARQPSPPMERNDDVLTTHTSRRLGPGGRDRAGHDRLRGWGRRRRLGRSEERRAGSAGANRCPASRAEDGMRALDVTGVQTCALPIVGGPGHPLIPSTAFSPWLDSLLPLWKGTTMFSRRTLLGGSALAAGTALATTACGGGGGGAGSGEPIDTLKIMAPLLSETAPDPEGELQTAVEEFIGMPLDITWVPNS